MDAHTPHRDGQIIAADNDAAVLRWLGRFEWLTARQLARLVWPAHRQGRRMAQRTLSRLIEARAVLRRALPTGNMVYVLGEGGARRLREMGDDTIRPRGYRDLKFNAYAHRAIGNDFAIDYLRATGSQVYTEAEIQRGVAPKLALLDDGHQRIPDLLIYHGKSYEWVEVENAYKSRSRLDALVAFAYRLLTPPENPEIPANALIRGGDVVGHVNRFRFVCPTADTVHACFNAIERFGSDRLLKDCVGSLIVDRVSMSPGMVWLGSDGSVSMRRIHGYLRGVCSAEEDDDSDDTEADGDDSSPDHQEG